MWSLKFPNESPQMMGMLGLCVKIMACLLDKQYLYMELGMVNICTVKAPEFNPSSSLLPPNSHFPFVLSAFNTRKQNNKRGVGGESRLFYHQLVCVVLWRLESLSLLSTLAGRRCTLCNRVSPRRHLSSRDFVERTYLFLTSPSIPALQFLSITLDKQS